MEEELVNGLGWFKKPTKTDRGYAIEESKYREWRKTIGENSNEDDEDVLEEVDDEVDNNPVDHL